MNPVVKAQLLEFKTSNPIEQFDDQDYFEVYSIFSIANGMIHKSLEPFDMHLKGKEFGLDGVGILVQDENCPDIDAVAAATGGKNDLAVEFLFFQAKRSEKFEYGEISKFLDAVNGFFDGTMRGESDQLDDFLAAKDEVYRSALRRNPKLRCFYATTGGYESSQRIEKLIELNRSRLDDLSLFDSIEIEMVGAKSLQAAYRTATNSNSATFEFPKSQTLPRHGSVEQAHIGYVAASELLRLVSCGTESDGQINSSVFFDNIRDYNPKSEINRQVIDQLEAGDASSFVFKNNGVTVVATAISRTGDRFTLDNYQIVNGCQTCNILFHCKKLIRDVHVPLRLIGSDNEPFVSSIIIGTNKQNEVKDEQFWALRPFMKDLEEYCRQQPAAERIFFERRENQYRKESVERTRIVKPSDLLKCVAAMFLFKPNRAARDYRGIRSEFEGEIFQEEHSIEPYCLACFANYKFNFMVRNNRVDRSWKIYKYYALYGLGVKACKSKSIFGMAPKGVVECCGEIEKTLMDEDVFVAHIKGVATILDKIVADLGLTSRSQIRDQLRLENFGRKFIAEYTSGVRSKRDIGR